MSMRKRDYVFINVYWFGLAFLWNGLHPIILPAVLIHMVPESLKNTYLGGMTFAGLILAMVIQPLSGALSDRSRSRFGLRRPWMAAGTLASAVILVAMAFSESFWWLLVTYILLQIASNFAHGPAQGLIPDLVPEERLGTASGFKNLFDMAGLVVASVVAGQLMGNNNPKQAIAVIVVVLLASAFFTIFTTREKPTSEVPSPSTGYSLGDLLRLDYRRYPDYARLILSRFLILIGIYTLQSFIQYFISDRLGMPDPAEVTGNLLATIGVGITLIVFPAGLISDRVGRKRLNIVSGGLAALGIFLVIFAQNVTHLYIVGAIIGIATGIFVSVNWALAMDLIPGEEAGKYMGLSNLATAGSAAVSRLGGPLIDGVNALQPGTYLGYPVLFVLAAICAFAGTLLLRRVREG
jgi:Na+/melibiose symporter-like transporter